MTVRQWVNFKSKRELQRIERLAEKAGLNFSNYIRQMLGLEPLKKGGARRNKGKRIYCIDCKREGKKTPIYLDDLCRECWHRSADGKAAAM